MKKPQKTAKTEQATFIRPQGGILVTNFHPSFQRFNPDTNEDNLQALAHDLGNRTIVAPFGGRETTIGRDAVAMV